MSVKQIIPCLDVNDGKVVKGVLFRDHKVMGDIEELAQRYQDAGADQLVLYDISASPASRRVDRDWVKRVARLLNIPFCVAGGIKSPDDVEEILAAGATKISINSPALARPELIDELSDKFGKQVVVVGIDSLQDADGVWRVRQYTGDPDKTRALRIATLDWVKEVQRRGAGEIVVNCMGNDGVRQGYDIEQLKAVRAVCDVSLVASGGAGARDHFVEVFNQANVDAALGASVFHSGDLVISELKAYLETQGIKVNTGKK